VRVTVEQASILQGFRHDHPWQGPRTARFRQIGNAVCPPVARAVLAEAMAPSLAREQGGEESSCTSRRAVLSGSEAEFWGACARITRRRISDVSCDATGDASGDATGDAIDPSPTRPVPRHERSCADPGFPKSNPAHEARS
jgi:hypothetical protein